MSVLIPNPDLSLLPSALVTSVFVFYVSGSVSVSYVSSIGSFFLISHISDNLSLSGLFT